MEIGEDRDRRLPLDEGQEPAWTILLDYHGAGCVEFQATPYLPLLTMKNLLLNAADELGNGQPPNFPVELELHYFHPCRTDVLMSPEIGAEQLGGILRQAVIKVSEMANQILDAWGNLSPEERAKTRLKI